MRPSKVELTNSTLLGFSELFWRFSKNSSETTLSDTFVRNALLGRNASFLSLVRECNEGILSL